ncbi:Gfo/Idh/MocA family protein [Histidinibacterium lentulum]|uniref:Gfo/Idh/MocA family oxidoreductase n=1 Tax=Histidinibacterium lentulum TaxID=2480588 RepID=A0A3N2R886_9RHOB|nr:Gfo/Idh/MocA family oxidoreductase [Histidinibacterium lentulum]ROU03664.1 gfo/Idh/MocA family oxidoreductase [Histidinibacterium lentulum]
MTVRAAIVGAGGIGTQHAAAMAEIPDAIRLTNVCDTNDTLAETLSAKTGAGAATLDAILADPAVDLVDICLPPALHVPVALRALEAGKHVICEKPVAGSMADIARLQSATETAGRELFPVFQYRYGPAFRHLAALDAAGLLGAPRVASLDTHWSRGADYYAVPWRGTWEHEMGGAVLGHAIHIHDLIGRAFGQITEVAALTDTLVNPIETEDCAALALRTARGGLVSSSITLGAAGDESRLRLVYERATVESARIPYAPGSVAWTVTARDPEDQAAIDAVPVPEGLDWFAGYLADVAARIENRPNTAVTLAEGAASIELVTAIYRSARTGERVRLPLEPGSLLWDGWRP